MNITESIVMLGLGATVSFNLRGGVYNFSVAGTFSGGSITLQQRCADNATFETVSNIGGTAGALSSAAVLAGFFLPPGVYQFLITGSPSLNVSVASVPT